MKPPLPKEPTTEALKRRQRIESFIAEIGKNNIRPLTESSRSFRSDDPDLMALDEVVKGYNDGDIDSNAVFEYYKMLSPYLTSNEQPVRDEDIEVFKTIKPGEVILADNRVQTVHGEAVRLSTRPSQSDKWRTGYTLTANFDTTSDKSRDFGGDVAISLHHLADRVFVGANSISTHLAEYDPTVLSEDNWRVETTYANGEVSQAQSDLDLLRSIVAYEDIAKENPEATQKLIDAATANTKFVLGLDTEEPTGMQVSDQRTYVYRNNEYQTVRDFVEFVREFDPSAYEEILNSIGELVASDPTSETADQYVRFISWVNQPVHKRTSSDALTERGRIDGVSVAESVPVFNDLMQRGQLAS